MHYVDTMERTLGNWRLWHALAQGLCVVALVPCVGCGEAGGDGAGDRGDALTDARVMDGNHDDRDAAGRTDSGSGHDSGTDHDAGKPTFWSDDSTAIDFTLRGPVAQLVCKFSATRDELTPAQLAGLSSLQLHDAKLQAGCDIETYAITVHAQDGSSKSFLATIPICASQPIVLFAEFDAWAQSTPCSTKSH